MVKLIKIDSYYINPDHVAYMYPGMEGRSIIRFGDGATPITVNVHMNEIVELLNG